MTLRPYALLKQNTIYLDNNDLKLDIPALTSVDSPPIKSLINEFALIRA